MFEALAVSVSVMEEHPLPSRWPQGGWGDSSHVCCPSPRPAIPPELYIVWAGGLCLYHRLAKTACLYTNVTASPLLQWQMAPECILLKASLLKSLQMWVNEEHSGPAQAASSADGRSCCPPRVLGELLHGWLVVLELSRLCRVPLVPRSLQAPFLVVFYGGEQERRKAEDGLSAPGACSLAARGGHHNW